MGKKDNIIFSSSTKLADLIDLNYHLLGVLSRLGISLGFGENTIAEVCRKQNINVCSFLLICHIYSSDSYIPSQNLMAGASAADIVRYLHVSHSFYMSSDMSSLEKNLEAMTVSCSGIQKNLIKKFFADYKAEVESHFSYEEEVVFPYVLALTAGKRISDYSIEQFEDNHSNINDKLNDLKNIVMKYLPDTCDTVLRNNVLYHLFLLENDLEKHTIIENTVLVPLVNRLERNEERHESFTGHSFEDHSQRA